MARSNVWTILRWATLSAAFALALAGCAAQATTPPTSPAATTNDVVSVKTPAVTPTATFVVIEGTPGADGPACHASQLTLKVAIDFSSALQMGTLTNTSTTACSLFGFPGVQLLDAQRNPMTTRVSQSTSPDDWSGVSPEQHVELAAGASAYFDVKWSATPTGAQTTCPTAGYLAVTAPNDASAIVATDPISACGGDLTVSPFQNAPFMES